MKRFISLVLAVLFFLNTSSSISADGMLIPRIPNQQIYETGQKAVIWHENDMETLILSTSFKGQAEEFVWVVPVPSRPTIDKGIDELFTSLEAFTRTDTGRSDQIPLYGSLGVSAPNDRYPLK